MASRPGAAQPAAPHQGHGHHRRAAGRDAAREPPDGQPARHPGRDGHAGDRRRASTGSRWWTCSRTTSAGCSTSVDLVIDHHPQQPGYSAVFKDIRPDYGSTCTILTEHLRAVDVNISERTATAMLYAIKSDTLFFNRQANRVDLEAFSFLYPLADAAMIRKMEGAEITLERLEYVTRAQQTGACRRAGLLRVPRRRCPARTSSPTSPTSSCSSRTSSGRSSPASSTTRWSCRCATSATRATPASSCASCSPTSAAPAATARWPRPSCRCRRSAASSGCCRTMRST